MGVMAFFRTKLIPRRCRPWEHCQTIAVALDRDRADRQLRGPRRRRGRHPGQERFSGQHEPRDPHAHERHHRHERPGPEDATSAPSELEYISKVQARLSNLLASSTTSWISPRSRPASWPSETVTSTSRWFDEPVHPGQRLKAREKEAWRSLFPAPRRSPARWWATPAPGAGAPNLASNAVKFTDKGGDLVATEVVSGTRTRSRWIRRPRTPASALPGADRPLFQAFSQADTSTTRKYGGTGLGLDHQPASGATSWAAKSGGKRARPGQRPSVYRRLRPGDRQSQEAPGAAQALRGMKVLVVDDNATSRQSSRRCWHLRLRGRPGGLGPEGPGRTGTGRPRPPFSWSSWTGRCRAWTASTSA